MAIYHLTVKIKSRGKGNNTIASAAYRANEKLHDERTDRNFRFRNKEEVAHSEILKPEQAPENFSDREKLWNAVEKFEKRSDARLAREIEFSLPNELDQEQQLEMTREFFNKNFVSKGYVVDFSLHKKDGNNHVHGMITDRQIDKDGNFSKKKDRSMNGKEKIFEWRKSWEEIQNQYLERAGLDERVSCESYEARGIKKIPTIHEGFGKGKIERQKINEEIRRTNQEYQQNQKVIAEEKKQQEILLRKIEEKKQQNVAQNEFVSPAERKAAREFLFGENQQNVKKQHSVDSTESADRIKAREILWGEKSNSSSDIQRICKQTKWSPSDVGKVADYYLNQIENGKSIYEIGVDMGRNKINEQRAKMVAAEMQKKAKAKPAQGESKPGAVAAGTNPLTILIALALQKLQEKLIEAIKESTKFHGDRLIEAKIKQRQRNKKE